MKTVDIGLISFHNDHPFVLIAGPCSMESKDHALKMAEALTKLTQKLSIPFIFKTSFDKANRTSLKGKRGIGLEESLPVFDEIRQMCPVITDVHSHDQCKLVSLHVDMLQIPAFLCRQTDLLRAAAQTKKPINIKKGQFLAPWDVKNIVDKMVGFGCEQFLLCERGTSFGYNNLVVDMRSLAIMKEYAFPVIFDATHSVQQPGGNGHATGGNWEFAPLLARAALAVGVAGIFIETHDNPSVAISDGPNMIPFHVLEELLKQWIEIDAIVKISLH